MKIVTTKDELKLAIKQKEKSILIKSKLANAIRKELKAWLLGDNDPHRLVLRSGSHIFDSYTHNRYPYTFNQLALCLHHEA